MDPVSPATNESDDALIVPEFTITMRGYDRAEVDAFVERVEAWAAQERSRYAAAVHHYGVQYRDAEQLRDRVSSLESAAESQETPTYSALGHEAAALIERAAAAADELRSQAAQRAEATIAASEKEATRIIDDARNRARSVDDDARRDRAEAKEMIETARARAETEAAAVVSAAEDRASHLAADTEKRRMAAMAQLEDQRAAVGAQIALLQGNRNLLLDEFDRVRAVIDGITGAVRAALPSEPTSLTASGTTASGGAIAPTISPMPSPATPTPATSGESASGRPAPRGASDTRPAMDEADDDLPPAPKDATRVLDFDSISSLFDDQ